MIELKLIYNRGFNWVNVNSIYFKGYFYFDGQFYKGINAISILDNITDKSEFIRFGSSLNGVYTLIFKDKYDFVVISDTTRLFPIFYCQIGVIFCFSDDNDYLIKRIGTAKINNTSKIEFLNCGYVSGRETLINNIYQTVSDEVLVIENGEIYRSFKNDYLKRIKGNVPIPINKLYQSTVLAINNAFSRLANSLKGQPIILPLSGGYDSRLIAVMLKKHRVENVTCITYGRENHSEIETSKLVADQLGFKWIFIEYNQKLIDDYINSDVFINYYEFCGKKSSMPFMQEYFAIKYLKENSLVKDDSIIISGYAGDILGGSQFVKELNSSLEKDDVSSLILKNKFIYGRNYNTNSLKTKIENTLNAYSDQDEFFPYSIYENYDVKERLSKFIFNAANTYLYFSYEVRFPFWDLELLEFFKEVESKYKKNKYIYDKVLRNNYFKEYDLNFNKEHQSIPVQLMLKPIKDVIKRYFTAGLNRYFLKKNDWMFYNDITECMLKDLGGRLPYSKDFPKYYNSIIIEWYLNKVELNTKSDNEVL